MYRDLTNEEATAIAAKLVDHNPDVIWAVIVEHPLGKGVATCMSPSFGPMPMITTHEGQLLDFFRQEVVRLEGETGLKHTLHRYVRQDQ